MDNLMIKKTEILVQHEEIPLQTLMTSPSLQPSTKVAMYISNVEQIDVKSFVFFLSLALLIQLNHQNKLSFQ